MTDLLKIREAAVNLAAVAETCEFVGEAVHFYRQRKDQLAADLRTVLDALKTPLPPSLPLDRHTREILGRPNFACRSEAEMLRVEGVEIPRKSEAEQAAVINWLLNLYLAHGDQWYAKAAEYVRNHIAKHQTPPPDAAT